MSDNDDSSDHDDEDGKPNKPEKPSAGKGYYTVGYKRPPVHSRYQPGQSGNPKGHRNGSKNIKTLLEEHLRRRVPASVDGKRQRITKGEALVVQTLNKAINDPKVGLAFMQYVMRTESGEQPGAGAHLLPRGPEQDRIIEEFLRAVRASDEPDADRRADDDDEGSPGADT